MQGTAACDIVSATYVAAGKPHWTLRDSEVLLVDGDKVELLPATHRCHRFGRRSITGYGWPRPQGPPPRVI
jgi:hypothetical protein